MDVSAVSASIYDPYAAAAATRTAAGGAAQGGAANAAPSGDVAGQTAADTGRAAGKPVQRTTEDQSGGARKPGELTRAQQDHVRQLQQRDQEVRQHEMAHLAASGGLAVSGPTYTYQRGPDGVSYAVGGEVNISTSPGRTPQETIARAETIIAAAMAPADPSGQDRAVAAEARQMAQQAMAQEMSQRMEKAAQAVHAGAQAQRSGIGMYRQVAAAAQSGARTGASAAVDVTA